MKSPSLTRRALVCLALWLTIVGSLSAIVATRVTVATTATLLYTAATGGSNVLIRNPAGGASVYLGAAAVTTATGFELVAGDAVTLPLGPSDPVYGIVTTGTVIVHVMESRR
jgi:hypothetical protein